MSQTSKGKSQPIILIVNLSVCVFQMRMSVSVTEFSKVSSLLSSPTFSSVRVGGGGGSGGGGWLWWY